MYAIICSTNPYQASRNPHFRRHHTSYVVDTFESLKDAQREMLNLFNNHFETSYSNWGLAVANTRKSGVFYAFSLKRGLRGFDYDGYMFEIVENYEEDED